VGPVCHNGWRSYRVLTLITPRHRRPSPCATVPFASGESLAHVSFCALRRPSTPAAGHPRRSSTRFCACVWSPPCPRVCRAAVSGRLLPQGGGLAGVFLGVRKALSQLHSCSSLHNLCCGEKSIKSPLIATASSQFKGNLMYRSYNLPSNMSSLLPCLSSAHVCVCSTSYSLCYLHDFEHCLLASTRNIHHCPHKFTSCSPKDLLGLISLS
jgi:hypothetical protein